MVIFHSYVTLPEGKKGCRAFGPHFWPGNRSCVSSQWRIPLPRCVRSRCKDGDLIEKPWKSCEFYLEILEHDLQMVGFSRSD
jgi:hypothetical protein